MSKPAIIEPVPEPEPRPRLEAPRRMPNGGLQPTAVTAVPGARAGAAPGPPRAAVEPNVAHSQTCDANARSPLRVGRATSGHGAALPGLRPHHRRPRNTGWE